VLDDCHFIVGTFSKTLGAIGGYCVSDDPDFDILRVTVRSYMFTASLPPSIVASVRQALRVVKARPELRKQLWDNVSTLYDGSRNKVLRSARARPGGGRAPARSRDRDRLLARHARCRHYVTSPYRRRRPNGVSLLRCSLCAVHTSEQLEHMIEVMTGIGRQMGVLPPPKLAVAGGR